MTASPRHKAGVLENRELCVPVQKDEQQIPDEVLNIVRWIDREKYDIETERLREPLTLTLDHLNPLLADLPTPPGHRGPRWYDGRHISHPPPPGQRSPRVSSRQSRKENTMRHLVRLTVGAVVTAALVWLPTAAQAGIILNGID